MWISSSPSVCHCWFGFLTWAGVMGAAGQIPSRHPSTVRGGMALQAWKKQSEISTSGKCMSWELGMSVEDILGADLLTDAGPFKKKLFACFWSHRSGGLVHHCCAERGNKSSPEDACTILPGPGRDLKSLAVLSTVENSAHWHCLADNWLGKDFFRAYTPPPPTLAVPESPKKV